MNNNNIQPIITFWKFFGINPIKFRGNDKLFASGSLVYDFIILLIIGVISMDHDFGIKFHNVGNIRLVIVPVGLILHRMVYSKRIFKWMIELEFIENESKGRYSTLSV